MKHVVKLRLAVTLIAACALRAQAPIGPAKLDVNLGVLFVDRYDGTSQNQGAVADDRNCGPSDIYRNCVTAILANYNGQGIGGVAIQFGMAGGAFGSGDSGSTPFSGRSGSLNSQWLNNLTLFFEDLRANNIQYVSLRPSLTGGFAGDGTMAYQYCATPSGGPVTALPCASGQDQVDCYPWLPTCVVGGYYYRGGDMNGYNDGPYMPYTVGQNGQNLPGSWGWSSSSPFLVWFDSVLVAAKWAGVTVREVAVLDEMSLSATPVAARIIWDNVNTESGNVLTPVPILGILGGQMALYGFSPGAVTVSVATPDPPHLQDCNSVYGRDSAILLDQSELFSAIMGGAFGILDNYDNPVDGLQCGTGFQQVQELPTTPYPAMSLPTVTDIHLYPCDAVLDPGYGAYICDPGLSYDTDPGNPSGSTMQAAKMIYNDVAAFLSDHAVFYSSPVTMMVGETDSDSPDQVEGQSCPGSDPLATCPPDGNWHRPHTVAGAQENAVGFSQSALPSLSAASTILRPFDPMNFSTILTPTNLNGTYIVPGCSYTPPSNGLQIAANAQWVNFPVYASQPTCQWSVGLPPPANSSGAGPTYPNWFTLTSSTWQTGSGTVYANIVPNTGSSSRSFQLMVAGELITVTQSAPAGQPPAAPTGLSPADGSTGVSTTPTLSWNASAGASYYFVYLQGTLVTATYYTSYAPDALQANYYFSWYVVAVNSNGQTSSATVGFTTGSGAMAGLDFYPVTPCRVANASLSSGQTGTFYVQSSPCGIPSTAVAYSFNITAVPTAGYLGILTTWPTGGSTPNVSTLNSYNGTAVANAAVVPAGTGGAVNVYVTDPTQVLLDINGYFAPAGSGGLEFFTLTPCRIADTRNGAGFSGAFGPPSLAAGNQRSFPVLSSSCGVPSAAAYSLNFTVVPPGSMQDLVAWAAGLSMPGVSMLNDPAGMIRADAAIVSAGTSGAVETYATDNTDMLFDINGYFASPGAGLHFYPVTPCRVADTRNGAGFSGAFGPPSMSAGQTRSFPIPSSSCGIPATAAAYSLNFTVLPYGSLGNLSTWPAGMSMPNVSTLNDNTGTVVSNAAIVPAGTSGAINVYVSDATDVLFDINGYFAP